MYLIMRLSACTITDALLNMHTDYSIPALSTTFFIQNGLLNLRVVIQVKLYIIIALYLILYSIGDFAQHHTNTYVRIYTEWRELYGKYVIQWKFGYDRFFRVISWRCLHSVCDV